MEDNSISFISAVIPVLNEEKHIGDFLKSLLAQDYDKEHMEILFVDGGSSDRTVEIIERLFAGTKADFKILHNEKKTAPCAMNLAIRQSRGEIIVRMDAHSWYPPDYVSKCVYYLKNRDADNVGGTMIVKGQGLIGTCIEKILTCRFGVGSSVHRSGNEAFNESADEYTDTVFYGTFYRSLIEKIGYFDENYPRAEDNDFNYRIRKSGGKVLLVKDIHFIYYCRNSVGALLKMGFGNGYSIGSLLYKEPEDIKIKYFVPFAFLISVVLGISLILFTDLNVLKAGFALEMLIYFSCVIYFSCSFGLGLQKTLLTVLIFPLFHLSYGAGVLMGLLRIRCGY